MMKTKHRARPATPAESARALETVRKLFAMTPREKAEADLRKAKALMTIAAQAVIAADPDAERLGNEAVAALQAAQAELERLDGMAQ